MMDRAINLLVIDDGSPAGAALLRAARATLTDRCREPEDLRLHVVTVEDLDDAASHLRHHQVDAILLNYDDETALTWLQSTAADRPILVSIAESDLERACQATSLGAEDVVLLADLTKAGLVERVVLAIARKAFEQGQQRYARQDRLTGLANTTLLKERFVRALARSDRFATLVGLVAIDIDGPDRLIGRFGKQETDRLLVRIGQRLLGETRQMDTLARTRGHGFTWLVEGLSAVDDVKALVNRMPKQLARPFAVQGEDVQVTASVGVALAPYHGRDFQSVHSMAVAAMLDVWSISGDSLLMLPVQRSMRSTALT